MIWLRRSIWILTLASLISLQACGIYSFTGASIPAKAETVTIKYFPNNASLVNANLSQIFTNKLKDRFQSQTNLNLTDSGGDLYFEGEIVEYKTNPVAIQGNDQAAMNRLTISVKVNFRNRYDEESNFETTFSRHADFDSNQNLSAVENQLVEEIVGYLVDDIFNKSVVNW
ncbi:MAG: LptE family protein [Bacteroidota bacterium]